MNAMVLNCSPVRDGATARIAELVLLYLAPRYTVRACCVDEYAIQFCRGCRACHSTARCVIQDDAERLIAEFDRADLIVCVSPSYWADIPGQFKAFIDRCTPWCDTHTPHAALRPNKTGGVIALRTGTSERECQKVIESIEHFYGHMHIAPIGSLALTAIERREDAEPRIPEIKRFVDQILAQ